MPRVPGTVRYCRRPDAGSEGAVSQGARGEFGGAGRGTEGCDKKSYR